MEMIMKTSGFEPSIVLLTADIAKGTLNEDRLQSKINK